jgi:PAS domain S-box-containing protein
VSKARSLRLRATLVICGLILAVVATYAATAYEQMRRAALQTAGGQLTPVAGQLAAMLGATVAELRAAAMVQAAEPALARFIADADSAGRDAALAVLRTDEEETAVVAVELRNAAGEPLLVIPPEGGAGAALDPELARLHASADSGVVGPVRILGSIPAVPVLAPVFDAERRMGSVIRWQSLSGLQVISSGARVYLTNRGGDFWTDLSRRVDPLAFDLETLEGDGAVRLIDADGLLMAGAEVAGTPWVVIVAFPRALIVGGPQRTIGRMILFGLLILFAAGLAAWMLSGRLTGSVAELASAARAISAGDYARRTAVTGEDEIGTLGGAFNSMAANVEDTHRQLEQKVAELAASEARNRSTRMRLEHVISSSGAILYTYGLAEREMVLEWVSENVKRLLGYTVEDAKSPGLWRRLRHPDDRERFRAAQKQLEAEGTVTLEYRLRHADGQYRWVRDEQRLLRDEAGHPREVVGVLSDVSEHRRLEGAKEAAEAANLAKNEFLSRMSHELRTPLNSVLGFGQLLQLDVESEENRESVSQILKAGQHLLSLIDEVLDIARIESGQMSLSVEPVFVSATVQEALDLVRLLAAEQGISVRAQEALACEHFVRADQQRLKQVLLNLLSNAIKYNRREGTVTLSCEAAPQNRIRIVVADTGFGIAASKMQRLFTPFERLDADQAGVEGTGLGLALSLGLMEAMGGTLGVESEPGRGSRFWIELPRTEAPAIVDVVPADAPPLVLDSAPEQTHTVLFIEDNLANVRLLERLFQRRPQVRLLTAMQGSLGLQLAREQRPDLILLDLNLPDLPGDVVLRHLRQDPDLREIPIVMISGDAIPSQVQRVLDLGAAAYITKPFDIQELLRLVDVKLEERAHI